MSTCKITQKVLMLTDISIDARAILLFMIGDNVSLDHIKAIIDKCNIGKTRAYRIMQELIENGYVERHGREECKYKPLSLTRKTLRMMK